MSDALPTLSTETEIQLPSVLRKDTGATQSTTAMGEERDQWPSRLSFVLAAMGGAVGVGNLLRYPSIAAKHNGLQWFIPYTIALLIVGIPILALEIALGQSMRGGAVVAFGAINRRLRGLGFTSTYMSFTTATYYVIIMSWVMTFFRYSFVSPLPWLKATSFFQNSVVMNVSGVFVNGSYFLQYRGMRILYETLGWSIMTWILIYFSIFKGVSFTGKVVYVTMLLPLLLCVALLIRAVTLPNAGRGIMMYVGSFSMKKLRSGEIWKDAIIQIFFSIGIGFGTFIAYSSYNTVHANAVQDALIVSFSNSAFEVIIGFAAFAIIGMLNLDLSKEITSFSIGFETYPQALGRLPGANVWAALFFLTIYLLAIDSAFALVESFAAIVTDSDWGKRVRKPIMMGIICFIGMLLSSIYSTQFGFDLLDAVDTWLNGITLIFCALAQMIAVTSMYRYKDVISQTGLPAFALAQASYLASMVLGTILFFTVNAIAGISAFACLLVLGTLIAAGIARDPEVRGSFGSKKFLNALWWLTSYSGSILTRDLNEVIAQGTNWNLPMFWAPIMRWLTAPVLSMILGIGYNSYVTETKFQRNPLHIFSFILSHVGITFIVVGFFWPKSFAWLSPRKELESDKRQYVPGPGVTLVRSPDSPAQSGNIETGEEVSAGEPAIPHIA